MVNCGLRAAFVWLCKPQTIEDYVLYHAAVVHKVMRLPAAAVLRYVSWACPGRTDAKIQKISSKDNPRVQAWMTTVSHFIFFRSKTDLVYRHEWLCRSGNGHGGSILTPQAENKNYQSVGTCSTWKMQSWLENTSVAFAMCIVQQSRSLYRLYV